MPSGQNDNPSPAFVSNLETDEETLCGIDVWIAEKHPAECESLLEELLPGEYEHATTTARLLAHCINHHNAGLSQLSRHASSSFADLGDEVGVLAALRASQDRLLNELMERTGELERDTKSWQAILTLLRAFDADRFSKAWSFLWKTRPPRLAELAGVAVRAAAWSPEHNSQFRTLLEEDLKGAYRGAAQDVIYSLMRAPLLTEVRDGYLARLLHSEGIEAAKLIIRNSRLPDASPVLVDATKLVLERDPHDEAAPIGVARCLEIDLNAMLPTIVEWMNSYSEDRHIYHRELDWRLPDHAATILPIVAEDALERSEIRHAQLARTHHHCLCRHNEVADWLRVVADWLNKNVDREEATRYSASLVIEALSGMHRINADDLANRLQAAAKQLHARAGTTSEEDLIIQNNLSDLDLPDRSNLIGIALARDVGEPPAPVDMEVLKRNFQRLPYTRAFLGGPTLDQELDEGKLPANYRLYRDDLEAQLRELDEKRDRGVLIAENHQWICERLEWVRHKRESWESRFKIIDEAEVTLPAGYSRRLRQDPYIWNEMRVLARLVSEFKVTPEPKELPGMGNKLPEFLLESSDGTLIFELATIGQKPSDLRTGVKRTSGGEAKKILNRKIERQFQNCETGITLPVVLGIQVQSSLDLEFGLTNSLYGPLAITVRRHRDTGAVAQEGPTRSVEKAFFDQDNVGCISAIAGIGPNDRENGGLIGQLHRPLRSPDQPLQPPLWVRLRTALFGHRPVELVDEMRGIPGIAPDEADGLVDAGVDSADYFAAKHFQKPDTLAMDDKRWNSLVDAAQHQRLLASTHAIAHLRAARDIDLTPLEREGIYLVEQLYREQRPPDFPLEAWIALRDESEQYLGKPADAEADPL